MNDDITDNDVITEALNLYSDYCLRQARNRANSGPHLAGWRKALRNRARRADILRGEFLAVSTARRLAHEER